MAFKLEIQGNYVVVLDASDHEMFRNPSKDTEGEIAHDYLILRNIHIRNSKSFKELVADMVDASDVAFTETTLQTFLDTKTGGGGSSSSAGVETELAKLTDSNRPSIVHLDAASQTFTGFKSIEVSIYEGTGSVGVQDETAVTFPKGSITGVHLTLDDTSSKDVTVDVTSGKALITLIY